MCGLGLDPGMRSCKNKKEKRVYTFNDPEEIKDKKLIDLQWKTITGKQLNKILGPMPLLKFMYDDDIHHGMYYVTGLNEDYLEFDNSDACKSGGIYVTTLDNAQTYCDDYGLYARQVHVPDDAMVYVENDKLKCNKIILSERVLIKEMLKVLVKEYVRKINNDVDKIIDLIVGCPVFIQWIDDNYLSEEIYCRAIARNDNVFECIDDDKITHEMRMIAVRQYGGHIGDIEEKDRTSVMILEAIKEDCMAIQYLAEHEQTFDVIMEAVKQDGSVIKYLKTHQLTHGIIAMAVEKNSKAITYLDSHQQTMDIIMRAIKYDANAIQYIDTNILTCGIIMEAMKQNIFLIIYMVHVLFNSMKQMINNFWDKKIEK